jgi:hypothetical protein
MKRRKNLILLFILLSIFACQNNTKPQPPESETLLRNYCTEIGRFDLIFYEDEVSGAYSLLPKKSLGAVWGKLENRQMIGRWIDKDGQGDILIEFNQDFSWFTTSYRNDELPEKWYKNQWNGHLRPNNNSEFETNGKKYMCE